MFFFPDQHLGRNTGAKFGIPLDKMALWNPHEELGGNTEEELHEAKLILWRGHCTVHGRFKPWHVDQIRKKVPGVQVLVHPECTREVVELSRSRRFDVIHYQNRRKRPCGSKWAIGTEVNLVNRLPNRFPDKVIRPARRPTSACARRCIASPRKTSRGRSKIWQSAMFVNEIKVDDETKKWALVALERMISMTEKEVGGK